MKPTAMAMVATVGLLGLGGCATTAEMVRGYAAHDLNCPAQSILTEEIAQGTYIARGCGRNTLYMDNNAPSLPAPTHRDGRTYVTLAAKAP